MWRMLQQPESDDYVLATNETHTVREFVEAAFSHAGLDWQEHVKYDARYERPAEVDLLIGDPAKAKEKLGGSLPCALKSWCGSWWRPTSRCSKAASPSRSGACSPPACRAESQREVSQF